MNSKTDLRRPSDPNRDRKGAASTALRPLPHGRGSVRSAFTLVELLVVIAVIGLLISILVPALNAIRLKARETTTKGTLGTLGIAIETYKADGRVGGGYPPSRSDADGTNYAVGEVGNPYNQQWSSSPNPLPSISGAGLLVWALVGADLLGPPGFQVFRTGASSFWSDDTDAGNTSNNPSLSGAYALRTNTQQPLHPRSGHFVDVDKISISRANPAHGHFEIDAEVEAREEMRLAHADRFYPMFLDSFGYPILYWRADPAGERMADRDRTATGSWRGIYHWIDNGTLIQSDADDRLVLRPGNDTHRLDWEVGVLPPHGGGQSGFSGSYFQYYIRNDDVQAKDAPHTPDTHLLITPGADGLYGTADDIANFEHNGEE